MKLTYRGQPIDASKPYLCLGELTVKYTLVNGQQFEVPASKVFWKYFTYTDKDMVAIVGNDFRDTLNTEIKNVVSMEINTNDETK